jgi:hypothetical protein
MIGQNLTQASFSETRKCQRLGETPLRDQTQRLPLTCFGSRLVLVPRSFAPPHTGGRYYFLGHLVSGSPCRVDSQGDFCDAAWKIRRA